MRIAVFSGLLFGALLSGCSAPRMPSLSSLPGPRDLPFIHKIEVQQGNVVTQEMVAQLRRGMDKKKVRFVMGTPVIQDTFNANRWDYIYTFQPSGDDTESRRITLIFVDDKLDRVEGNVKPAAGQLVVEMHQDTTVDVPKDQTKGLMAKIKDTIPFTGADDEAKDGAKGDKEAAAGKADAETSATAAGDDVVARNEDETLPRASPYDDIQAAPGEGIIVPPDAPKHKKRKGFFARLVDGVGLGSNEDDDDRDDDDYDPGDPRYRDISNPDDR